MGTMHSTPAIKPSAQPLSFAAQTELTGGRRVGVLVSHGFTGSPSSVGDWARSLAEHGFAVEVPRLPGHGTTWQEMNTTTYTQWYAEIVRVFTKLRAESDVVVVAGLSMGGSLVLKLAAEFPDKVDGVVLVNPAIAAKRWDVKFLPVLKHVIGALKGIGSDIKKPGVIEDSYPHTPLKAAHSMFSAWPAIVEALPAITSPVLYFRSTVDRVVDETSEPLIRTRVTGPVTMRRLTNSYHVATVDNDAQQIFDETADFVAELAGLAGSSDQPASAGHSD